MERWHETPGMSWIHRGLDGAAPDAELAGVVLGRGYAHQSVASLGVAGTAAAVLRRELARPVETEDGRVLQVRVQVDVDLQDTLVLLSGEEAALRACLTRLQSVLSDPASADLTPPSRLPEHPYDGWQHELAAWFGVGPASLSAQVDPLWAGSEEVLRSALADLHPARGTRAVGITTLESLVGSIFVTPVERSDPAPLTWRERGPESLRGGYVNHLLAARARAGAAGSVAQRLLLESVHNALLVAGGTGGLAVATTTVGEHRLVTLRAVPTEEGYDAPATHAATVAALEACRELSTDHVSRQVEAARSDESVASATNPVTLAIETLRRGVTQTSHAVSADLAEITDDAVRTELAALLDHLLLGLPAGAEAPIGYPAPEHDEKAWSSDLRGLRSVHTTTFPVVLGNTVLHAVTCDGEQVRSVVRPAVGHVRTLRVASTVDLSQLAVRIDRGDPARDGWTTLIDRDDHQVDIPWAALKARGRLRRQVDAAAPAEGVLTLPPHAPYVALVAKRRRTVRRVLIFLAVLVVLVGPLIAYGAISGPSDDPTVLTVVARGEQASLSNGSRITVSDVVLSPSPDGQGQVLVADVRFCGGGPTRAGDRSTDVRNYIAPGKFSLDIAAGPLLSYPPGFTPLPERTLADGDCLEGQIGFLVFETQDVGIGIRYSNLMGDEITWR